MSSTPIQQNREEKWTKIAGTQCDLTTLGIDQKVAYGDGKTFYYLIEPLTTSDTDSMSEE